MFVTSVLLLTGCCTTHHITKWEYKLAFPPAFNTGENINEYHERVTAVLDDLGKDGWILVSQTEGRIFYFKRPVNR